MTVTRLSMVILGIAAGIACSSAKPAVQTPAAPPPIPIDTKVAWILQLEQQRQLRDTRPPVAAVAGAPAAISVRPDLAVLLRDDSPAVRRRTAMAIGRIGMPEGVPMLTDALTDADATVRAEAAFGLGLIGAKEGLPALQKALADADPLVRTRAVTAVGLIGDAASAPAVLAALPDCGPWLASVTAEDEAWPKEPQVELCREALFTMVRLRHYDGVARLALTPQGEPVSYWWPVAFALQRIGDARAAPALRALAQSGALYSSAFAIRGLASLRDEQTAPIALAMLERPNLDIRLQTTAIRALGQVAARAAVAPLRALMTSAETPVMVAAEAIGALGRIADPSVFADLVNLFTHSDPVLRAAAIRAAAAVDDEGFVLLLSSLAPDRHWSVRVALAEALAELPADRVRGAVEDLTQDADDRVKRAALDALAQLGSDTVTKRLFDALDSPDFAIRATAAEIIGTRKLEAGVPSLVRAYQRAEQDAATDARIAALEALAKYGTEDARQVLRRALGDRDWSVRRRAAALLTGLGETATPVRPAPVRNPPEFFESDALLRPEYSPQAYITTRRGVIQLQLNVIQTPFTAHAFMELARAGFYNGLRVHRLIPNFVIQTGDPRGDGSGGPGFTIRDEFSPQPFVRGTVGIAHAGPETGGSQFFITLSPQPHLNGQYTAFAQVVQGFEILDRVALWDEIVDVRIWDGVR